MTELARARNSPGAAISRRVFMGRAGRVAAGVVGAAAAGGLVAACGERTRKAGTVSTADGWAVTGAAATPEVIVTTSRRDAQAVSVYDAGFGLLRRGRLQADAGVDMRDEWQEPTLSFPYAASNRSVLRRIDLESGADELVFTADPGRGIGDLVAYRAIGGYLFAYFRWIGPHHGEGRAIIELWSASPGSAKRIPFEDSYLAVMSDAETDPRENSEGMSPLTMVRPLAVTPDGRSLLFARNRLYLLELSSGKVEPFGTRYGFVNHARLSPDGTRAAVSFQDPSRDLTSHLAIVDLGSGRAQEVQFPGEREGGLGVWHPDGSRVACVGAVWRVPKSEGHPERNPIPLHSAVFLADADTGETVEILGDPSASGAPATEDAQGSGVFVGHTAMGFSRDGRTLFVREGYMVPNPTPTTSPVREEYPEPPGPLLEFVQEIVAVDLETRRRTAVLRGLFDMDFLLHR